MKKLSMSALLVLAVGSWTARAQTPGGSSIQRLDPALDAIVSPSARVEMLKEDYFGNAEGPVWIKDGPSGYLLFSDLSANDIYKWTPDRKLSVFIQHAGFSGGGAPAGRGGGLDTSSIQQRGFLGAWNGRFYPVSFGSNGVTVDPQGRVVWCAQGDRAIVRLEKDGKTRTVLANQYKGQPLDRPNDLVVRSDGWVYFTDVRSNNVGADNVWPSSVYRVKEPGTLELLADDIQPNGIALSPDEKYLYVGGSKIWRYDLNADGTITNRRETDAIGCDGMKVDQRGNIFCATAAARGVRILSPDGKHLGTILTPQDGQGPQNLAFGDADGKTLYITIKRSLARVRLLTTGFRSN